MLTSIGLWVVYFIPALLIEVMCYILAPIVGVFVTYGYRNDVVKRFEKRKVTLLREYLPKYLYWFQTHDNAVDEYWYGVYNVSSWFKSVREWTQHDYDNSRWVRYYCRVAWLWRNCGYGFLYNLFSQPKEDKPVRIFERGIEDKTAWYKLQVFNHSFQLELQLPLGSRYFSMNVGWKAHKEIPRLLYANRVIGLRRY